MNFRRRKIIANNFQRRWLVATLLHLAIVVLVAVPLALLSLGGQLEPGGLDLQRVLAVGPLLLGHWKLFLALLALSFVLVLHSILVSHRAAGPMVRVRQILLSAARGNLTGRAKLRKNDYLNDEADALNEMMVLLDRYIGGAKADHRLALDALRDLRRTENGDGAEARELEARLDDLGRNLRRFTTTRAATNRRGVKKKKPVEEPAQVL